MHAVQVIGGHVVTDHETSQDSLAFLNDGTWQKFEKVNIGTLAVTIDVC